jgi:hypothetical protein
VKKKLLFGTFILLTILAWYSCNDELVIAAEPKDIPVVSGLVAVNDTTHYIRVEKAFLDPETSALTIAQIADSIYYPNALVILRITSSSKEYVLEPVDANFEGYEREPGIFANSPNRMYKIDAENIPLEEGQEVELIILRNENSTPVTATTELIEQPEVQRPQKNSSLNIVPGKDFKFLWLEGTNAAMFNVNLIVHIAERTPGNPNFKPRILNWEISKNVLSNQYEIDGQQFFSFLGGQLDADNTIRRLDSIDVEVAAGGEELLQLLRILQANTGITGTQEIPTFSNLSEGLGIFSSINKSLQTGHRLTDQSSDSLKTNQFTRDLGF